MEHVYVFVGVLLKKRLISFFMFSVRRWADSIPQIRPHKSERGCVCVEGGQPRGLCGPAPS